MDVQGALPSPCSEEADCAPRELPVALKSLKVKIVDKVEKS